MKTATKTARMRSSSGNVKKKTRVKTATKAERVQESSGNVFADLGLRNPQDMLAKAQLAHRICQVIAAEGLTQMKAAEIMDLDQPKISALMRGKLKGFSADRLFRCLNDLGQEVEITIRPVQQTGRRGGIHVAASGATL
ncbi:MAG: helix-turn-helix domain-containing protein [Gemmataceae bacterium]|nr:helix-turn-helix domain-containing protein [Gemmataceae bacterium]